MSTLEKAIGLMESMPEHKLQAIYTFIQFIGEQPDGQELKPAPPSSRDVQSVLGIAQEYANPALINQEEGAFERATAQKYAADRY